MKLKAYRIDGHGIKIPIQRNNNNTTAERSTIW